MSGDKDTYIHEVLRHPLVHQTANRTKDAMKQPKVEWVDGATFRGSVKPLSGRELVVAQQIKPTIDTLIVCRRNPSDPISADDRIKYVDTSVTPAQDRFFGIEAVINPGERNRRIMIYCKEQKPPL